MLLQPDVQLLTCPLLAALCGASPSYQFWRLQQHESWGIGFEAYHSAPALFSQVHHHPFSFSCPSLQSSLGSLLQEIECQQCSFCNPVIRQYIPERGTPELQTCPVKAGSLLLPQIVEALPLPWCHPVDGYAALNGPPFYRTRVPAEVE